MCIWK